MRGLLSSFSFSSSPLFVCSMGDHLEGAKYSPARDDTAAHLSMETCGDGGDALRYCDNLNYKSSRTIRRLKQSESVTVHPLLNSAWYVQVEVFEGLILVYSYESNQTVSAF